MMSKASVLVEFDAGDDGPPRLVLNCPCGHASHQYGAYPPARQLFAISRPSVRCERCGLLWEIGYPIVEARPAGS